MAVASTHAINILLNSLSPFPKATPKFASPPPPSIHILSHHALRRPNMAAAAAASSLSQPFFPPLNVEYYDREFSGHGVNFQGIGDSVVVRLGLEDGSTANLMLPSGLITSYKPHMWHGGCEEVLHTVVSQGKEAEEEEEGEVVVQGGVSLGLKSVSDDGDEWSPGGWFLHDVQGNAHSSIQVELRCSSTDKLVNVRYLITLEKDILGSEIIVANSGPSPIQLLSSFMSHLTVSTPDAVYAVGLERANYFNKPPLRSEFSIIPPDFRKKSRGASNPLRGLFFGWNRRNEADGNDEPVTKDDDDSEKEEEEVDNYLQLTEKMSRTYTYAPRRFTIIDRGRRNSVVVGRIGFEEFHVYSPGSQHEWYGKYAFVCAGPSNTLKPVTLAPQDVWRGAQVLHNPSS
ncbi:protein NDH-DEPENDENT CYCLIC ELECTRON FLOW 5 [Nymphaea colorata]|nr:protein NDH-DEPENDENT CYCLIC ELECTRON FLOW 5 [Nymphaea colorata]